MNLLPALPAKAGALTENESTQMEWQTVAKRLFPAGHTIRQDGEFLLGTGQSEPGPVAVIGTTNHTEVGVELALQLARAVLDVVRGRPKQAILFLVDTCGQKLRHRDEMLGLNGFMAHLAKCVELARRRGHPIISLVYDQALSGGFLAYGMMADICAALPEAEIRVMGIPAMARVTRIPEARLKALAESSPVFAPGAENYVVLGGLDAIWDGDLAKCMNRSLNDIETRDLRRLHGFQRGGRSLAHPVSERVATVA
jgi:malonate decarboxylase gamma subunit